MEIVKKLDIRIDKKGKRRRWYIFKCSLCGQEVDRTSSGISQTSCGCIRRAQNGETVSPVYNVWCGMISRCSNQKSSNFHRYGGRGIIICDEWKNSFLKFKSWAMENGYAPGMEIDRIDNNGNYDPSNCRFTSHAQNNRNKRTSKLTWVMVDAIRDFVKIGLTNREISKIFSIHESYVSSIKFYKNWKGIAK